MQSLIRFTKKRLIQFVCVLVCACSFAAAHAEIFRWTDANGNVHFSDRKSSRHENKKIEIKINTIKGVSHSRSKIDIGKKVVMYSASWCGVCKSARRYFQRNAIAFTEYDIEKSLVGSADFKRLRGRGVPVILIGKKRMNGFSPSGFKLMYEG